MGKVVSSTAGLGILGNVVSSPAGSGSQKHILVYFERDRTLLVAHMLKYLRGEAKVLSRGRGGNRNVPRAPTWNLA